MDISARSEKPDRRLIEVRLENFRLFKDSGWLQIAPLTCIVGRNSSGKSSLITALLLLKQSIENEVFGSAITPLALSGQYCDLGQFKDVVHDHDEHSKLSFSFRIQTDLLNDAQRSSGALVPTFGPKVSKSPRNYYRYGHSGETGPRVGGTAELRLTFSADEPFGPSLSHCDFVFSELGNLRFVRTISGERKQHWRTYGSSTSAKSLVFRPYVRSFFPVVSFKERAYKNQAPTERSLTRRLVETCRDYFGFIESLLGKSEMIGPFRQPPERRYKFAGFGASRSGPSGEQAIDLLITEALLRQKSSQPLLAAVSYWLRELKLLDSLRIINVAKNLNLFEVGVKLNKGTIRTNLADVGFGVSQILPVLIQGLLMEPGGIYVVQEPEIHLHPDAQAALADFFIYLAFQGVTVIAETHSEYLLLRLRRRLAECARPALRVLPKLRTRRDGVDPADISFLFSHAERSNSTITKLELGPGFQFENLPKGFMSQITSDRMELLKAVSKQK